ncbi:hypothetical protein CKM354_001209500 [Cercospora kikuchii]|uniref:Epoxide hydrolase N-terminal domain-containing protein n=1 Tax=Cercospora kikuchii TaxID=84275 RepID=A0A9P3CY17_9PEZI|nr:uncharacterized protein CKM354_001209500 [Cercospora kikuchii]GIZ49055.1 hypothetical protein CKM354_001209500 [Cercospora kikuchii]
MSISIGTPQPFTINIPDSKIEALNSKLANATFPTELQDAAWSMGSPLADVKRLANHWHQNFSWRNAEKQLNSYPQYTVPVKVPNFEELEIHFIHQRSKRENAIPLLFIHGWPGSYFEVLKLLPLLTDPEDQNTPAFHVVAPSLAGYAWSQYPSRKGFGLKQHAEVLHGVMKACGYESGYVSQGGDWGGFLCRLVSKLYPESVKAVHTNFPVHQFPKPWKNPISFVQAMGGIALSSQIRGDLAHTQKYLTEGDGYLKEQDTKPQTLGYGLTDSPVALLAWIYEKLHDWTDSYPWTDDEVCTWISIYAFSREGPSASTRIYYESAHPVGEGAVSRMDVINMYIPNIPLALAYFPQELARLPKSWAWSNGPIVQQTTFDVGGHFAAFEVPELLAGDLRKLFGPDGPCEGVVKGKKGF